MHARIGWMALAVLVFASASPARGERPPQDKEEATHVVVGTVEGVFSRRTREENQYVVQIRIETVERGEGYAEGDLIYAYCFQRRSDAPRIPAAYGHKSVPKVDQHIRAYLDKGDGRYEGLYPNWFEQVPAE